MLPTRGANPVVYKREFQNKIHSRLLSHVSDITSFLYTVKGRNCLSRVSVACHRYYRLFAASVNCRKIVTGNAELTPSPFSTSLGAPDGRECIEGHYKLKTPPSCRRADTHLLKLQRLQTKVLRITRKFPRRKPNRELHAAVKIPCIYDFIKK
jgi:hypothetical protein